MAHFLKICGVRTIDAIEAAAQARATHVGFVFDSRSTRAISLEDARSLNAHTPPSLKRVALVCDADDALIQAIATIVRPDLFQVHGQESSERVMAIDAMVKRPIIKAVGISGPHDLRIAQHYAEVCDLILFDAKPAHANPLAPPGGQGKTFDWRILRAWQGDPFILAGGLNAQNVAEAIGIARPLGVDVSSGVESAPGQKDPKRIQEFCAHALRAFGDEEIG